MVGSACGRESATATGGVCRRARGVGRVGASDAGGWCGAFIAVVGPARRRCGRTRRERTRCGRAHLELFARHMEAEGRMRSTVARRCRRWRASTATATSKPCCAGTRPPMCAVPESITSHGASGWIATSSAPPSSPARRAKPDHRTCKGRVIWTVGIARPRRKCAAELRIQRTSAHTSCPIIPAENVSCEHPGSPARWRRRRTSGVVVRSPARSRRGMPNDRSGATSDGHVPTRTVRGRMPNADYVRSRKQAPTWTGRFGRSPIRRWVTRSLGTVPSVADTFRQLVRRPRALDPGHTVPVWGATQAA
jgi:hypothetical protein